MHNFSNHANSTSALVRNEDRKTNVGEKHIPKSFAKNNERTMAKMVSCACGWTLISPQGDEDVKKHTMIHVKDTHPGMTMTQDDLTKMIKSV